MFVDDCAQLIVSVASCPSHAGALGDGGEGDRLAGVC